MSLITWTGKAWGIRHAKQFVPARKVIVFAAFTLAAFTWVRWRESMLRPVAFDTGYALSTGILFLAALHVRKKLPQFPLGKVSTWLRFHLDVAYFTVVLFVLHAGLHIPSGAMEIVLWSLFLIVAGSGAIGLYFTRTIPKKLAALPEEFIYERIPTLRRGTVAEARTIVLSGLAESSAVGRFYHERLAGFLESPRSWYYLWPNGSRRRGVIISLRELHRYLSSSQRSECDRLEKLIARKDDLDYHAALQGRLKLWLFLHVGFTYSLIATGIVHGILAHVFHGGSR